MFLRREHNVVIILCNVKFELLNRYTAHIVTLYIIDNNTTSHAIRFIKKKISDDVNGFIAVDIFEIVSCIMSK